MWHLQRSITLTSAIKSETTKHQYCCCGVYWEYIICTIWCSLWWKNVPFLFPNHELFGARYIQIGHNFGIVVLSATSIIFYHLYGDRTEPKLCCRCSWSWYYCPWCCTPWYCCCCCSCRCSCSCWLYLLVMMITLLQLLFHWRSFQCCPPFCCLC